MARHVSPRTRRVRIPDRRVRVGAALLLVVALVVAALSATSVAASWVDNVVGGAQFTTAPFGFESSVDGGATWAVHPSSAPAVLTLGTASILPGQSTYGAVSLRSVAGSPSIAVTVDGTSDTAGLGSVLLYTVVRTGTCTAASFGAGASFVVGSSTAGVSLTDNSGAGAVVLAAGGPSPGTSVPLCFRLTLPDTLAVWTTDGLDSTGFGATWTFIGS